MTAFMTSAAPLVAAMLRRAAAAAQAKSPRQIYTGILSSVGAGGRSGGAFYRGKPVAASPTSRTNGRRDRRFVSTQNRDLFRAKPEVYAPQYGGYCAWAVSQGYTAKGDLNYWKIVDGKFLPQLRRRRAEELGEGIPAGRIASANKNWLQGAGE